MVRAKKKDEIEPVEVFAGDVWQVEMVKGLLENANIEAYIINEIMGRMNPWWTAPGGAGSIQVFVASSDYEKAKPIVDEYQKNLKDEK